MLVAQLIFISIMQITSLMLNKGYYMKNKLLFSALLTLSIMPTAKPNNDALNIACSTFLSTISPSVVIAGVTMMANAACDQLLLKDLAADKCLTGYLGLCIVAGSLSLEFAAYKCRSSISEESKGMANGLSSVGKIVGCGAALYPLLRPHQITSLERMFPRELPFSKILDKCNTTYRILNK